MATIFKNLSNNDVTSTRTLLHENIPVSGTIVSGTYVDGFNATNVVNPSHNMYQKVYDYNYLSSSSNQIFDITFGYTSASATTNGTDAHPSQLSKSAATVVDQDKKINIYNSMAGVLVGHDVTGNIQKFDNNGDLTEGSKIDSAFFVSFSRLLAKDEIKKGTFSLKFATDTTHLAGNKYGNSITITDAQGATNYKVNSPAGEYGILYTSSANINNNSGVGLIYYQAGMCVLSSSIIAATGVQTSGSVAQNSGLAGSLLANSTELCTGSSIPIIADNFRNRLMNVSFNNTTELNSTIYFCRANHNEFNYSSNPSYVSGSKLRVKNLAVDSPCAYITTVGLYSPDNELLAVAKLSEPIKKDPTNELILRVRLDY